MKLYFVRHSATDADVQDARLSPYSRRRLEKAYYAKIKGVNYSEKAMNDKGYILRPLRDDEYAEIKQQAERQMEAIEQARFAATLTYRAKQVEICLSKPPLEVVANTNELSVFPRIASVGDMDEAYSGCGYGTAYLNEEGQVVAFHHGYDAPLNAPKCKSESVVFSCRTILFER